MAVGSEIAEAILRTRAAVVAVVIGRVVAVLEAAVAERRRWRWWRTRHARGSVRSWRRPWRGGFARAAVGAVRAQAAVFGVFGAGAAVVAVIVVGVVARLAAARRRSWTRWWRWRRRGHRREAAARVVVVCHRLARIEERVDGLGRQAADGVLGGHAHQRRGDVVGRVLRARCAQLGRSSSDVRTRHRRAREGGRRRIRGDARAEDGRAGREDVDARAVVGEGGAPVLAEVGRGRDKHTAT